MHESDAPSLDLLITGGSVLDGTGSPAVTTDVGVRAGRIVHVGTVPRAVAAAARRTLDATGMTVAPGFVDLHSHADFRVLGEAGAEACLRQGVTTLVTGNCGMSPFPTHDADLGTPGRWAGLSGFAAAVDAARPGVNIAPLVGHGALRSAVLGDGRRTATGDELARMRGLLAEAAAQGVFGLSTGPGYAPGSFADTAEVMALATEAAGHGLLYATHLRDEADNVLDALDETLAVGRACGVRVQVSRLKATGAANHGKVLPALQRIADAARDGVDVACDVHPYTASSARLTSRLPDWAMDGGAPGLLKRLADPEAREKVLADLRGAVGRTFLPEGVIVAQVLPGTYSDRVGQSVADIARDEGVEPAEAVLRVLEAHRGEAMTVHHAMADADVDAVLRYHDTAVAGDGWVLTAPGEGHPHPRDFGTFARVLGHYTRERGVLALADAVRRMTSLPASRLPLAGRGTLAVGSVADVVVFDPATVTDHATYDEPWQYATGVRDVFVAGAQALADGRTTGVRAGRTLLRATR